MAKAFKCDLCGGLVEKATNGVKIKLNSCTIYVKFKYYNDLIDVCRKCRDDVYTKLASNKEISQDENGIYDD